MDISNLSDYYMLFVYGLPCGAFLTGISWALGFAVETVKKWLYS